MANLKSLAKDTAIYGMSSIIGRFLNYLLVPLYTAKISAASGGYGVITNIYAYTALLLVILTYGMETTFFRYANKTDQNPQKVYSTVLSMVGLSSLLFIAMVFVFLQPICGFMGYSAHPSYVWVMAVTVAIDAFQCIPFAYLRYKKRPIKFAAFKLLFIALNIVLNLVYYLVLGGHEVGYAFYINLVCTGTITFCFWRELKEGFFAGGKLLDMPLAKKMLSYSWPILILGIAGILNQTAGYILFPYVYKGNDAHAQLGIFGAASKIAMIMSMITQAFRYAYDPFIFAEKKKDDASARRAYSSAMTYYVLFTLFIFLAVVSYMDVLKLLIRPAYYPGLSVVPWIMAGQLMFGVYFNLSLWYKVTDRTYWGGILSVLGCALTVLIIIVLAPRYGFMACAWASVIANGGVMLVSYFLGQRYYPVDYELKKLGGYVLLTTLCYALEWGIGRVLEGFPLLQMALNTVVLVAFALVILRNEVPRETLYQLRNKLRGVLRR